MASQIQMRESRGRDTHEPKQLFANLVKERVPIDQSHKPRWGIGRDDYPGALTSKQWLRRAAFDYAGIERASGQECSIK